MVESLIKRICRRVITQYKPSLADNQTFSGLPELAYWSVRNTLDVSATEQAIERKYDQNARDIICGATTLSHQRRALAYWKVMQYFQKENLPVLERDVKKAAEHFQRISANGPEDGESVEAAHNKMIKLGYEKKDLSSWLVRSKNKIAKLEELYDNLGEFTLGDIDPKYFQTIICEFPDGKIPEDSLDKTPWRVIQLAFWNSKNTLNVLKCIEAVNKEASVEERIFAYKEAFDSHQTRALMFWEQMHEFHLDNYTRAHRAGVSAEESKRLWKLVELSHVKIAKLEKRYLNYGDNAVLDHEIIVNGLPKHN